MAMAHCSQSPTFSLFPNPNSAHNKKFSSFSVRCSSNSPPNAEDNSPKKKKRLSQQSSWEAKDSEGRDYLYRLGKEAENMNIAVGARSGVIDDLFAGNFLGRDSDIVFDYRQKVTRSFEYLQGDYYIAPLFMDEVYDRPPGPPIRFTYARRKPRRLRSDRAGENELEADVEETVGEERRTNVERARKNDELTTE